MEVASFWEQYVKTGKVQVHVVDMPNIDNKMVGGIAWFNAMEREVISERTKVAMDRIKKEIADKGSYTTKEGKVITSLGNTSQVHKASALGIDKLKEQADDFAKNTYPLIKSLKDEGMSLRKIAKELNDRGIKTSRDTEWYPSSVNNVLRRVA